MNALNQSYLSDTTIQLFDDFKGTLKASKASENIIILSMHFAPIAKKIIW